MKKKKNKSDYKGRLGFIKIFEKKLMPLLYFSQGKLKELGIFMAEGHI